MDYFALLSKLGSVNAKPVHAFMLAVRVPSREAFKKAIEATAEANMIHLEAMAKEHFALLMYGEKEEALANDYIISSYWLYREWGAHAKALTLSQQYEFIKVRRFTFTYLFVCVTKHMIIVLMFMQSFSLFAASRIQAKRRHKA